MAAAAANPEPVVVEKDGGLWRDLVAYWVFGLCNNYGYVVMLSAAHDIIDIFEPDPQEQDYSQAGFERDCHMYSTGAILLADIIPCLIAKIVSACSPMWVKTRVSLCVILALIGFCLVAFAESKYVVLLGVIATSAGNGLGESTFLAYSGCFDRHVISTWSSGTGGAGVIGSISYAGLVGLGCTPRLTMLISCIIPATEFLFFFLVLRKPDQPLSEREEIMKVTNKSFRALDKVRHMSKLWRYMLPLVLVYYFEYFINQGLFELIFFENTFIDRRAQYRWLNVDYQIGVFVSRSSLHCVKFRRIWIFAVLQGINVVYFLLDAIYLFTPCIYITFLLVFWEGLLGGGGYVNTFYRISVEQNPEHLEFSFMIVAQSDSYGIMPAGFTAIPVHNAICKLPGAYRKTPMDYSNYTKIITQSLTK